VELAGGLGVDVGPSSPPPFAGGLGVPVPVPDGDDIVEEDEVPEGGGATDDVSDGVGAAGSFVGPFPIGVRVVVGVDLVVVVVVVEVVVVVVVEVDIDSESVSVLV
jgi:hypothetical protein